MESGIMYTLNTTEVHVVCLEHHPQDSRIKMTKDGICQTLPTRMGTGGGNVPLVMISETDNDDRKRDSLNGSKMMYL